AAAVHGWDREDRVGVGTATDRGRRDGRAREGADGRAREGADGRAREGADGRAREGADGRAREGAGGRARERELAVGCYADGCRGSACRITTGACASAVW